MAQFRLGASPRAALGLLRTGRVFAALRGRSYVVPGDVQTLAEPVLGHRVLLSPSFEASGGSVAAAISEAIGSVPAPPHEQDR
jgi:MoxR-like ATPase